jgi:hypothetical protein
MNNDEIEALRRENAALRARIRAFEDDYRATMAETCSKGGEGWVTVMQHCACVPHLRKRIKDLETCRPTVVLERTGEAVTRARQEGRAAAIHACVAVLRDRAQRYEGHTDGHDLHRAEHIESDAAYLEREVRP